VLILNADNISSFVCNLGSVFCRYNYSFYSVDVILDLSWMYFVEKYIK